MTTAFIRSAALAFCAWTMASGVLAAHPGPKAPDPGGQGVLRLDNPDVCLKGSFSVPEVCGKVQVAWKFWVALDEPMGDFDLVWKPTTVRIANAAGGGSLNYPVDTLPTMLAKAMQRVKLRVDAVASVQPVGGVRGPFVVAFHTGQPVLPGEVSTSAPHGYDWDRLFHDGMSAAALPGPAGWCVDHGRRSLNEREARTVIAAGVKLEGLQLCPESVVDVLPLERAIARTCESAFTGTGLGTSPHFCAKKETRKFEPRVTGGAIEDAFARLEGRKPVDVVKTEKAETVRGRRDNR